MCLGVISSGRLSGLHIKNWPLPFLAPIRFCKVGPGPMTLCLLFIYRRTQLECLGGHLLFCVLKEQPRTWAVLCIYLWNELRSKVKVTQSCLTLCDPMDYTDSKSLLCYLMDLQVLHTQKRSFKQQDWCFILGNNISVKVTVTVWLIQIQSYYKQSVFTFQNKWQVFFICVYVSHRNLIWNVSLFTVAFYKWKEWKLFPWNSPGPNNGVGSHSLLQEIFPTQRSNPGLPHCRQILYQLSHKGSPRILEWVACHSPVDLPDPGIQPRSPELQVDSLPDALPGKPY